jgi:hypothetical protein
MHHRSFLLGLYPGTPVEGHPMVHQDKRATKVGGSADQLCASNEIT